MSATNFRFIQLTKLKSSYEAVMKLGTIKARNSWEESVILLERGENSSAASSICYKAAWSRCWVSQVISEFCQFLLRFGAHSLAMSAHNSAEGTYLKFVADRFNQIAHERKGRNQ